MTYSDLTGCAIGLAICWDLILLRTNLLIRKGFWVSYAIMLAFQLLINGVLTGVRVVRYDRHTILGARIAYAPVEDIGFGFSLILITLSWWVFLDRGWSRKTAPSPLPMSGPNGPDVPVAADDHPPG